MHKRRSHARFVVANGEGVLRVACDVSLTSTDGQLVVISVHPLAGSDRLMLEMHKMTARSAMVPVRVDSRSLLTETFDTRSACRSTSDGRRSMTTRNSKRIGELTEDVDARRASA